MPEIFGCKGDRQEALRLDRKEVGENVSRMIHVGRRVVLLYLFRMSFAGKRVLLFAASLFGYQDAIKSCLEQSGAKVDYFDERPANSFFVKAMIRINRNTLAAYIDRYHLRIAEQTKETPYDYILVIKGESMSSKTIKYLKHLHPQAQCVIYHWDSIANNANALRILPLFDRAFSFDRNDCRQFGMTFLPLFYMQEYADLAKESRPMDYDLLFVGTTHSDRYSLVNAVTRQIDTWGGRYFTYFFFPSKILYYKMRLLDRHLRGTHARDFHFKALGKQEVFDLFARTKATIDIQHPRQTGLTMRCIEALGAKKKLITTNAQIKEYDFYREQNILVIDRHHPVVPAEFFNTAYEELPETIYRKYSLENWLHTVLS